MRAVIDPAADAVWDAVVITSTREGIEREVPDSDDDWLALEHQAVRLLEAGNLLQIEGRAIAGPDSVSELPGIDLEPADIAVRVAGQYDAWLRSGRELHDAGVVVLEAVRARSINALLESGDRLDAACESCHSRFWYPAGRRGGGGSIRTRRLRRSGSNYPAAGVRVWRQAKPQRLPGFRPAISTPHRRKPFPRRAGRPERRGLSPAAEATA